MMRNILGICKDHLNYITMADCKHFRHRRTRNTEEKVNVVTAVGRTEFIQFFAAEAIVH